MDIAIVERDVRQVFVIFGFLVCLPAAQTATCGLTLKRYDPNTELCCGGEVFSQEDEDGLEQGCCTRAGFQEQLYPKNSKICCGIQLIDCKDETTNFERKCLNSMIYVEAENETVCGNEKYIKSSPAASCCGSSMYEPMQQTCCRFHGEERLYSIIPNKAECCKLELYNTEEFDCNKDTGQLYVKSKTKTCVRTTYDPTKEVCCLDSEKVHKLAFFSNYDTDLRKKDNLACYKGALYDMDQFYFYKGKDQYQSQMIQKGRLPCGNSTYYISDDHCCDGNVFKKTKYFNSSCCGPKTYNKETESCCSDMVINKAEKDKFCCGDVLYQIRTKDDQNRYKRTPHEFTNCCGIQPYNRDKEVCCQFQSSLRAPILKTKKTDTKCCPITYSNATSYNEFEELCIKGIGPCPKSAVLTTTTLTPEVPSPQSPTPTARVSQTVDCPYCGSRTVKSIQVKKTCDKKNKYYITVRKIADKGRGVMMKVKFRATQDGAHIVVRIRMKFHCKCIKENKSYVIYTNRNFSNKVRKHGKQHYNLLRLNERDLILKDSKSSQKFRGRVCNPKERNS